MFCAQNALVVFRTVVATTLLFVSLPGIDASTLLASSVLITVTSTFNQWNCFGTTSAEGCCQSIINANMKYNDFDENDVGRSMDFTKRFCTSQLATIPNFLDTTHPIAPNYSNSLISSFSMILPREINKTIDLIQDGTSSSTKQFEWHLNGTFYEIDGESIQRFPYLDFDEEKWDRKRENSMSINSELSQSGGMHRSFHHQIELVQGKGDDYTDCFVFVTVPSAMFIDVDDAYGDFTFQKSNAQDSSSFLKLFENPVQVHAAGVCDIEQPSFVSRQHIIIFQTLIDPPQWESKEKIQVDFSSKIHLRYPEPSIDSEQFVVLPDPQLLCRTSSGLLQGTRQREPPSIVRIAAGNDEDYEMVMWTTISACLLGVIWMMIDISHVAIWDP